MKCITSTILQNNYIYVNHNFSYAKSLLMGRKIRNVCFNGATWNCEVVLE